MKLRIVTAWLFLTCSVLAQAPASSGPASAPGAAKAVEPAKAEPAKSEPAQVEAAKIDPTKEADIRRLLEVTGITALMLQAMSGSEKDIKPLMINSFPPGEYRAKLVDLFFAKFNSKIDSKALIDLIIPIYDKNLSREDVQALVTFYSSPLGHKVITVLPQISAEAHEAGKKWGETLGRDSMQDVFAEHPEMVQAVRDAGKAAQGDKPWSPPQ